VTGTGEQRTAVWINGGHLPNSTAAVSSRFSAIVRHVEGLPKHRTALRIERYDAAAKAATRICRVQGQDFFVRRDANVNNAIEDSRRSSDDRRRMCVHLGHPLDRAGPPVY